MINFKQNQVKIEFIGNLIAKPSLSRFVYNFLKYKSPYFPQHFLCFFPLPQGQGSFRPTFFSATIVFGGFNKTSKSVISSGLSGSNPIVYFQPFFSNVDATSFIRFSVWTLTMAGFFQYLILPSFFHQIFWPFRHL